MTERLAENLRAAQIKRSEVMIEVGPNSRHDSASWASRMPAAIIFFFGREKNAR